MLRAVVTQDRDPSACRQGIVRCHDLKQRLGLDEQTPFLERTSEELLNIRRRGDIRRRLSVGRDDERVNFLCHQQATHVHMSTFRGMMKG